MKATPDQESQGGDVKVSPLGISRPVCGNRLYKIEKLRSSIAIDDLFAGEEGGAGRCRALSFPLRAVWKVNTTRSASCPRFLIMVPKRRVRHAVDRVTMRRRIRESYRLNRRLIPVDVPVDIAFVYVDSRLHRYADVERAMVKLLNRIAASVNEKAD